MASRFRVRDPAMGPSVSLDPNSGPAVHLVQPDIKPMNSGRRRRPVALLIGLAAIGIVGALAFNWWRHHEPAVPAGIAWSNGRIEADEIDIDTKFPGRIATVLVDEGDPVKAGQVVARMDTRDLDAALQRDEATFEQAQNALAEARANIAQQQAQLALARKQLARTQTLIKSDYATKELRDQQQQQLDGAQAGLDAAIAKLAEAGHAAEATGHQVELDKVNIADDALVAPRDGRVQYRIANVGEVLPAGGKVFTTLDLTYVYMDIYLPTADAGKVAMGADARIVLDAIPDRPLPAKVTFLATQAQFTPKAVETKSERDKLMFRVRVRVDPEQARAHPDQMRTGLPGVAYIRFDPNVQWPTQLQPKS